MLRRNSLQTKKNPTYTGTFNISMDTWSCDIEVTNKVGNPGIKIVRIESTDENDSYLLTNKELNMNTDPFEISNF